MIKVLFVCLGNICRSPTAHGVFQHIVDKAGLSEQFFVDSAGTGAWHVGEPPDGRAQQAASERGYDLSTLRARQVNTEDFEIYDYILAMDKANLSDLKAACPALLHGKIHLFLSFSALKEKSRAALEMKGETEVPDPYYGGEQGFSHVLDLAESAGLGLLEHIQEHGSSSAPNGSM